MLNFLRIIFSPAALIFWIIIKIRNYLFDNRILSSTKVDAKVISVGNLTVGGSGKTPTVLMIAETLKNFGKNVGVLSRGYGRSTKGYLLVCDGAEIKTRVDECGDEIYFISEELKIPTAVSERRVEGAKRFITDSSVDTIILDDAFQHRWISRDIDIVIVDQRFLNKVDMLEQNPLPLGLMREPMDSLKRADIIIINRKFSEKSAIPAKFDKYFHNKKIFHGYYEARGVYDVKTHEHYSFIEFAGQKSLVVCGIAKPYSFLNVLEKNNIDIKNKMLFTDHKSYSKNEVQSIRKRFYDTNSFSVLTTQKDAVKLTNFAVELDDIDIYYLKIDLKLDEQQEFIDLINHKLN